MRHLIIFTGKPGALQPEPLCLPITTHSTVSCVAYKGPLMACLCESVTANFGGTRCPRPTIRPSVLGCL